MRVLLVEDSVRLQTYVGKGLRGEGYAVDTAPDGETGLWRAQSYDYDVIILDLMLPKLGGLELLSQFRRGGGKTHILILTAKDLVEDRVRGLNEGADDYLVKPFAFSELLARLKSLTRRKYGVKCARVEIGDLILQLNQRVLMRKNAIIDLQPLEYGLLELLALRRGQLVTRPEIEEHLWEDRVELMSNAVDVAICRLRRKIDLPGQSSFIQTRRGLGYVLEDPRV